MGYSKKYRERKSANAPWYAPLDNVTALHSSLLTTFTLIGNAESGALFQSKTQFFRNLLNACPSFPRGVELFYPTAPHRIQPVSSITGADQRITPEKRDFDAWTWGFGDYITEVMQGYKPTIRYILKVIQTAGPFIGIVGFSAGATTAHTLVSLAERQASPELMQNLQIDSNVGSFYISTPAWNTISRTNAVCSYFHLHFILPFAVAASNCPTHNTDLFTIRKFKRLFCILSGISIRSYPRTAR
jgi:hypothetical protein